MSLSPEEILARMPADDDPRDVLLDLLTHTVSVNQRRERRERDTHT